MMNRNSKKKVMGLGSESPKLDKSQMRIGEEPDAGGSIALADEGRTPDCAEMRKNRNKWLKSKHKIGTWNVRSMAAGKLNTTIEEAKSNNVSILGLAEHRWPGSGHFKTSCGGLLVYSGRERAGLSGV